MVPFRISIARLLRVAATLISVALVCSMSGCSSEDPHANTSPQTSMSDAARGGGSSGGTDEILRESKPSETLLADPLSGDWESNVPTLAPLDGGLDRAWVECMPKDTAESASWKRSADHTRVWLHTGAQNAADNVWSCMDDRLQLDKSKKTSDGTTWNGQSVNGYNIYQKKRRRICRHRMAVRSRASGESRKKRHIRVFDHIAICMEGCQHRRRFPPDGFLSL